jgi:hypothetical protein
MTNRKGASLCEAANENFENGCNKMFMSWWISGMLENKGLSVEKMIHCSISKNHV